MWKIFCDGSCGPSNPGPCAWGAVVRHPDGSEQDLCGFIQPNGTNNIAELSAAIMGLRATPVGAEVQVVTDSQYVVKGVTEWAPGWIRKGWKTADGSAVKNKDLWLQLLTEVNSRNVRLQWVKGHAGHPENERADELANAGLKLAEASTITRTPPVTALPAGQSEWSFSEKLADASDEMADRILIERASLVLSQSLSVSRLNDCGGWHTDQVSTSQLRTSLLKHIQTWNMVAILNLAAMILVREENGLG